MKQNIELRKLLNTEGWNNEELDTLKIMMGHILQKVESNSINVLTLNFRCSIDELRTAINTQLTCAGWSSGTDEVQHFATFMLAGSAPMPKYTEKAIQLLSESLEAVRAKPEHWEDGEAERLEDAIAFLSRFKEQNNEDQ
jgi:hypothetical protein